MSNEFNITRETLEHLAFAVGGEAEYDYSGRGMYGATCVGITVDRITDFLNLGAAIYEAWTDGEIADTIYEEMCSGASADSMGLGTIIYWHNIGCDDAPSDEDEESDDVL